MQGSDSEGSSSEIDEIDITEATTSSKRKHRKDTKKIGLDLSKLITKKYNEATDKANE